MSNFFTFINTRSEPVGVVYTFIDPDTGREVQRQEVLKPKATASSQAAQARFGLEKKLRLVNAEVVRDGNKFSVMSGGDAFGNVQDILKRSVIVDIETLGKDSGSVITQLGVYDVGADKGSMYVFQPSLIEQTETRDDRGFKNRSSRRVSAPQGTTFKQLKYAEFHSRVMSEGTFTLDQSLRVLASSDPLSETVEKELLKQDFFQGRYFASEANLEAELVRRNYGQEKIKTTIDGLRPIRNFMQALGDTMTQADVDLLFRQTRGEDVTLESLFKSFELNTRVDMKSFLTQDMPELLRGKVTWIANAAFESTQFGAQIDAEAFEAFEALNEYRASQQKTPVDQRAFFKNYSFGGFEEEFKQINLEREAAGLDPVVPRNPMYGVTQGISTYDSKPFYVTGAEFSAARAEAFETGDFSKLYKVFLETTRAGDVRDIIDLVRMQQSTLINQGFMTSTDAPASLSMEIQARVYGVTEAMRLGKTKEEALEQLFQKELHIGIGDVRLSEYPVLRESLDQLEALRLVEEGGEAGRALERQAARGEGAYFRAQVYGEIMDVLNTPFTRADGKEIPSLQDVLFRKRVSDSLLDIAESGSYTLREYSPGRGIVTQVKEVGGLPVREDVLINKSTRVKGTNINRLFEASLRTTDYPGANKEQIIRELENQFAEYISDSGTVKTDRILDFKAAARAATESFGDQITAIEERFAQNEPEKFTRLVEATRKQNIVNIATRRVGRSVSNQSRRILGSSVLSSAANTPSRDFIRRKMTKYASSISTFKKGYVGALGVLLGASMLPKTPKKNLLLGTKEEFISTRAKRMGVSQEDYVNALKTRYNSMDGLPEKGLAAFLRKKMTDFGSPYQSPRYSMSVLDDHKMRRERERYMSAQFGARHFSPEGDIGFFLKRFVDSIFRREMGYSQQTSAAIFGGTPIEAGKYNSLRGRNLTEYVVPEGSSITVEDADTITIRDVNKSRPNLAGITGDPGEMRVRLAGIDAPETAHGDRLAQPYAEEAKRIATEMIRKAKDVRIVAQKGNSTYGRQVAMVYADGVNVNLELLKRGAAAYLPYKSKKSPAMYNEQAFEEAQERAYKSKRGMWREPFFQAYKMITDVSNQTTTFNTLVNMSKVSKNGHLMSMKSMMDQAQEMGIDNGMEMQLADLGKTIASSENPFKADSAKGSWSEMDLQMYGGTGNTILSILDRQKYEIGNLMRSRGSLTQKDKAKTSRVTRNNVEMTKSVLAETKYIQENKARQTANKNMRELRIKRLRKMEQMQISALQNQFNSPIGHYRM